MRRLAVALSLAAAALTAGGCRAHKEHAARAVDGRALYLRTCAQCHGADGRGQTDVGRSLGAHDLSRPEVRRRPDAELAHQIVVGRGRMPAFGTVLDDAEVQALVGALRTLGDASPPRDPGR